MAMTVATLHKRLGEILARGHGRKPVCINKETFKDISECHAIDLRERDRSIKHWSGKCAEQAAVIEKLRDASLEVVGPFIHAEQGSPIQNLRKLLAVSTDSKQILAEWLDKVLGEPTMTYIGKSVIDCGEHGHHNMEMHKLIPAGTKLFKKPEIK